VSEKLRELKRMIKHDRDMWLWVNTSEKWPRDENSEPYYQRLYKQICELLALGTKLNLWEKSFLIKLAKIIKRGGEVYSFQEDTVFDLYYEFFGEEGKPNRNIFADSGY